MNFEMFYTVLGGLGIFFLGMKYMSDSMQAIAGDTIRKIINSLTTNRLLAVGVGALVTTIIQSSSVTTVMVVGMVNAGLMQLTQAIGVIFGANIGTTITGWIIAIKIGKYGLLFVGLGMIPMLFMKDELVKSLGRLSVALGLVFMGLETMSNAFKPLQDDPQFLAALHYFNAQSYLSVVGCIAVGCMLTMIVQSSSAMLGITIALGTIGVIDYRTALALVLGENIGTTITAILASMGTTVNAKRAARAHSLFNIVGVFIIHLVFQPYATFIDWFVPGDPILIGADGSRAALAAHIAMGHTMFNICCTLGWLPFLNQLAALVTKITPAPKGTEVDRLVAFSNTSYAPALGLEQAEKEIELMLSELRVGLDKTERFLKLSMIDEALLAEIRAIEDKLDVMQRDVTVFLGKVMEAPLTSDQSNLGFALIRAADEIEFVSDYLVSLATLYRRTLKAEENHLSDEAKTEFMGYWSELRQFCESVQTGFLEHDATLLVGFQKKTNDLSQYADRMRKAHFNRTKDNRCSAIAGIIYSDMILSARRIKNHTVNLLSATHQSLGTYVPDSIEGLPR